MMFCKDCGRQLKDGAQFCTYCGQKVTAPGASVPGGDAAPPSAIRRKAAEQKPAIHTAEEPGKPGMLKGVAIGVAIGIFIAVAGVLAYGFVAGHKEGAEDAYASVDGETMEGSQEGSLAGLTPPAPLEQQAPGPAPEPLEGPQDGGPSQYVLPTSSTQYLAMADLEGLTKEECMVARNEVYARHGRRFDDEGLQGHFDSCSWYEGTIAPSDFDDSVFNEYEKANLDLIVQYETDMGYR